jgi:hypothetical protein
VIIRNNYLLKAFLTLVSFSLILLLVTPNIANAQSDEIGQTFSEVKVKELIPTLEAIDEIPMELLESGDSEAINKYFSDNLGIETHIYNEAAGEEPPLIIQPMGWWSCSLAVAEVLAMNAIPIAKITKIKKYIDALGGVKMAAKLLTGATNAGEKAAMVSALIGELSGFTNVANACWR